MEPLLLFPDPAPPALAQALDLAGYPWKSVPTPDAASRLEPEDGWAGGIVSADEDPEAAFALCRSLRGVEQAETLKRLEIEHDNVRAALNWTLDQHDAARALRSLYRRAMRARLQMASS